MAIQRIARSKGIQDAIAPHRSYRRLPVDATGAFTTIPAVIIVEILVVLFAQTGLNWMSSFASFVSGREGMTTHPFHEPFVFVTLSPMTFGMRHADWIELLVVMLVCLLIVVVLSIWTAIAAPVRFFINLNALILGGAALYLFLTGHLGYDSAAFSELMLRTALLTWLVMPLFVGLFASLFPFSPVERVLFIVLTVAYDVPLSIVRYACFVGVLGQAGTIAMTDLYLVFGPLLDAVPIICFFSIFLVRVSNTLEKRRAVWGWL